MRNTGTTSTRGATAAGHVHRPGRRAAVVLGLGLLPLIVGLSRYVGLSHLLGPAGGATVLVVLVTAVWAGVVGWGGTPRPVATLTQAGMAAAGYVVLIGTVVLPAQGEASLVMLAGVVPVFLVQTAWGFLSGLLALAVQRLRGGRR